MASALCALAAACAGLATAGLDGRGSVAEDAACHSPRWQTARRYIVHGGSGQAAQCASVFFFFNWRLARGHSRDGEW